MSFEEHIDHLSSVVATLPKGGEIDPDSLEAGAEALAFSQSLWNLFQEQGLTGVTDTPDFYIMEKIIDGLYGELAAATLMFSEDSLGLAKFLDGIIPIFEKVADGIETHDKTGDVPPEVIRGFRAFAARLRNAQESRRVAAKKISIQA